MKKTLQCKDYLPMLRRTNSDVQGIIQHLVSSIECGI